jgi:hypothetical protein
VIINKKQDCLPIKAMHRTAISLRLIATGEFNRYEWLELGLNERLRPKPVTREKSEWPDNTGSKTFTS